MCVKLNLALNHIFWKGFFNLKTAITLSPIVSHVYKTHLLYILASNECIEQVFAGGKPDFDHQMVCWSKYTTPNEKTKDNSKKDLFIFWGAGAITTLAVTLTES